MKKRAIIAFGCLLMMTGAATAAPVSPFKMFDKEKGQKIAKIRSSKKSRWMKTPDNIQNWKPTTTKTFAWLGDEWDLEDTYTYTYDFSGNTVNEVCLDAEGDYVNTVYEYDANNKVVYKESKVSSNGVDFENNKKTRFTYDAILTDVITERTEWLWMKGDWQLVGNNFKRVITRDADGNVTSVVIAVLFNGIYDPTQRLDIAYGADGKAESIKESFLTYDGRDYYWEDGIKLSEIKWNNTDGQIHDIDMLFMGNNRIKSAIYEDPDDAVATMNAEYGEDGSYVVTMEGEMEGLPVTQTMKYTPYENDGYRLVTEAVVMGIKQYEAEEERYDEWGHLLLSYDEWSADDEPKVVEQIVGEVEFDGNDFPVSYTVSEESFDINTGDTTKELTFRAEYSDYIDVTAGVNIIGEKPEEAVKYFNLQGIPVNNPAPGSIVIRKQGSQSGKIRLPK